MRYPEEFLRRATDCKQMAGSVRDPASRAAWAQMAERWLQCAEMAKRQNPPGRYLRKPTRKPAAAEAHY
jgi:hypothetical protein